MPASCAQLLPVPRSALADENRYESPAIPPEAVVEDFLASLAVTEIEVAVLKAGAEPPLREGSDFLLFITQGAWICRVGDLTREAQAGDLVHVPRDAVATFAHQRGEGASAVMIGYTARVSETIPMSELLEFPAVLSVGLDSRVRHYFSEAVHVAAMNPVGRQQCLCSLVTLVLMTLVRDHLPDASRLLSHRRVVQMRRLLPAIQVLRRNLSTASSVDGFARRCGLSVAQFRRLFHSVFEKSPTQYIQQLRVREACRLLHYTDRTVNEICLQIGYEQPSHFHKTFKKFTGMTPRHYREEFVVD